MIVVLGCRVDDSGAISVMLRHRLDTAAAEYAARDADATIIVVSGKGTSRTAEADAMAAYLTAEKSIPADRCLREDQSMTTEENALCVARLLAARMRGIESPPGAYADAHLWNNVALDVRGPLEVVLVTSRFHVARGFYVIHRAFDAESIRARYTIVEAPDDFELHTEAYRQRLLREEANMEETVVARRGAAEMGTRQQ